MQRPTVEVQAQPQREGPLAVDLEAGSVAPVGAAYVLRARGVGKHLPRHDRVGVLVPLGVDRAVACRQRVAGRSHPLRRAGPLLHGGELGGDRLVLLVHLGEHGVQVVVGEHAARVLAEVATPLHL